MRILHTMLRVSDLDVSIDFYTDILGMKLHSRTDYPEGKFILAFVGYGESKNDVCIELTYNYGVLGYEAGNGFGHIAIGVKDIYSVCGKIKEKGGQVVREPGPMKHGTTVIAFVKDPDGYMIELIEE